MTASFPPFHRFGIHGAIDLDGVEDLLPIIEKAREDKSVELPARGPFKGILSHETPDDEDDVIVQRGIAYPRWDSGFPVSAGHPYTTSTHIGEITKREIVDYKGAPATQVEGYFALHDPMARLYWTKTVALNKAESKQRMGLSIEGDPVPGAAFRRPSGGIRYEKMLATSAAASVRQVHRGATIDPIFKAALEAAGLGIQTQGEPAEGAVAPLVPQSMDLGITEDDVLIVNFLRKNPAMTWAAAERAVRALRNHMAHKRATA